VHATSYLRNPKTAALVANFKKSEDNCYEDILKNYDQQYATAAIAVAIGAVEQVESAATVDEHTEVSEDGETYVAVMEEAEMMG